MLMHQSLSAPVRVLGTALAIAAASLLATTVASAKEDDGRVSIVVRYGDLDLSQSSDTVRLYSRLQYASEKVCNSYDKRSLRMQRLQAACVEAALNRAVERVNDPQLSQLHAAEPRIRVARKT
jgi:UrcA family protein